MSARRSHFAAKTIRGVVGTASVGVAVVGASRWLTSAERRARQDVSPLVLHGACACRRCWAARVAMGRRR